VAVERPAVGAVRLGAHPPVAVVGRVGVVGDRPEPRQIGLMQARASSQRIEQQVEPVAQRRQEFGPAGVASTWAMSTRSSAAATCGCYQPPPSAASAAPDGCLRSPAHPPGAPRR
jgi:hypothetical protein